VFNKPEIPEDAYYKYQTYEMYMGSFTLVQQKFFKSNLVYSYGRNEDIPYGGLLEITYGKEYNEHNLEPRDYYGLRAALGNFINPIGYLYGQAEYNTFINESVYEQGYLNLNMRYISNLIDAPKNYLRLFAELDYSAGFNRFRDEFFDVKDENGLRGFRNDSIFPDQRMYLNLETVAFNKRFFYGFRFAVFGFVDMVLISKNRTSFNFDGFISGIGAGIRVRNENLIFPTFVVRLGYYPFPPDFSRIRYIDATNEELYIHPGFDPVAPGVTRLR
jgi:hypothetical protein